MRIAVCDDLPEERARLVPLITEYLAARGLAATLCEYGSGEALLDAFRPGAFELIFLDIYMPGASGIEIARRLKAADRSCVVIFTTTSLEHGADAFDVDAFHYLVKPIAQEKLHSALGKWYEALCEARTVTIKCGRASREILVRDILYIDVAGRSSAVHTFYDVFGAAMSLAAIEALLPATEFMRPIRYCLVAFRHMRSVGEDGILLVNGETVPFSRREQNSIKAQLAAYRLRRLRGR